MVVTLKVCKCTKLGDHPAIHVQIDDSAPSHKTPAALYLDVVYEVHHHVFLFSFRLDFSHITVLMAPNVESL